MWKRGGEIIPKITGVDMERRLPDAERVKFVSECPECGTPLRRVLGEAAWCCPNHYGCRPQLTGKIEHFCARRMMNIDGIGEETAELLFDSGLVEQIADIYDLTADKLAGLDRIGQKSAEKIMAGIEASKSIEFERVVYALSIPNVGETTAKRLAMAVKDIDTMSAMSVEELTSIPDIGPVIGQCIYDFLRDPVNVGNIRRLREAGLQLRLSEAKLESAGDVLKGKSIVVSGTFLYHSRDEYKNLIERNGGKNVGSISKKTSFVLAGENMGPSKLEKCQALGIPILDEEGFLKLIDNSADEGDDIK